MDPKMLAALSPSGDVAARSGEAGERFRCPRCGYTRPLRPGEDGFRLCLQHMAYCPLAGSTQLALLRRKWASAVTARESVVNRATGFSAAYLERQVPGVD